MECAYHQFVKKSYKRFMRFLYSFLAKSPLVDHLLSKNNKKLPKGKAIFDILDGLILNTTKVILLVPIM